MCRPKRTRALQRITNAGIPTSTRVSSLTDNGITIQVNVTDVRFEPSEPVFKPEPHLSEPFLPVRFERVRVGWV